MKILFVSPVDPFARRGGENIRTAELISTLATLGHRVHCILGVSTIPERHAFAATVSFGAQPRLVADSRWALREHFPDREVARSITSAIRRHRPDVAFLDYGFIGQYIAVVHAEGVPVVLGTHNAQARVHVAELRLGWRPRELARLFVGLVRWRLERLHERRFFRLADRVVVVSRQDAEYHARYVSRGAIDLVPNFVSAPRLERAGEDDFIVMTANFEAKQNAAGVAWFLRNVWSRELHGRARLLLVGSMSAELLHGLRNRVPTTNVEATGRVASVYAVLARAKCAIVPLLRGSGTRLKCIEAMAAGVPIVNTSKGCEGIDHEGHIRVADSATQFRDAVLELLGSGAMRARAGRQLQAVYLKRYSAEACAPLLDRAVSGAVRLSATACWRADLQRA